MGGRYLRTSRCDDCDTLLTKMWQGGRAFLCIACAKARMEVATDAAVAAVEAHKKACRLEVLARRVRREQAERAAHLL